MTTIAIKIGEKLIELTLEEAKELHAKLNAIWPQEKSFNPMPYPLPSPQPLPWLPRDVEYQGPPMVPNWIDQTTNAPNVPPMATVGD